MTIDRKQLLKSSIVGIFGLTNLTKAKANQNQNKQSKKEYIKQTKEAEKKIEKTKYGEMVFGHECTLSGKSIGKVGNIKEIAIATEQQVYSVDRDDYWIECYPDNNLVSIEIELISNLSQMQKIMGFFTNKNKEAWTVLFSDSTSCKFDAFLSGFNNSRMEDCDCFEITLVLDVCGKVKYIA